MVVPSVARLTVCAMCFRGWKYVAGAPWGVQVPNGCSCLLSRNEQGGGYDMPKGKGE